MTIRARVARNCWVDSTNGPTCGADVYQLLSDGGALLGEYSSFHGAALAHNAVLDLRRRSCEHCPACGGGCSVCRS